MTKVVAAVRSGRAYLAGLAMGLLVVALAGGMTLPPLAARGDFAEQWAAARIVLEGGDPYDTQTWRADAARLAARASDARAFVYPPYVAFALTPLATLPLPVAATAWVVVSLVAAAAGLRRLLATYPAHPVAAFGFGFALFASGPALLALAQGQWDFLLLAALCASAAAASRSDRGIAAAALLFAKPQVAPLALLGLARTCDRKTRRWLASGVAIALAAVAATAVRADWWGEWLRGAARFQTERPVRTATLGTLFEPLGLFGAVLVIAVIALAAAFALRARGHAALGPWFAASVLVAPYVQAYDHLLLLAPLAIATSRARDGVALAVVGLITLVAGELVLAGVTVSAGRDVLGALVPLLLWSLVVFASRRSAYSPTNF